jgi:uncharacterized protein with HXXEE motif
LSRVQTAFGALVLAQAAHSTEESIWGLWESFPPARFVSGLVSNDLQRGFVSLNICIVAFGTWCYFFPVRRQWPIATTILWGWIVIEAINGITHPVWSVIQGGYTPGVVTSLMLGPLALYLAKQVLASSARAESPRPG